MLGLAGDLVGLAPRVVKLAADVVRGQEATLPMQAPRSMLNVSITGSRRFAAEMDEKARVHGERYPVDEDFLQALALMPQASGCAMGFDRLVVLATGAPRIDAVIWVPVPG